MRLDHQANEEEVGEGIHHVTPVKQTVLQAEELEEARGKAPLVIFLLGYLLKRAEIFLIFWANGGTSL